MSSAHPQHARDTNCRDTPVATSSTSRCMCLGDRILLAGDTLADPRKEYFWHLLRFAPQGRCHTGNSSVSHHCVLACCCWRHPVCLSCPIWLRHKCACVHDPLVVLHRCARPRLYIHVSNDRRCSGCHLHQAPLPEQHNVRLHQCCAGQAVRVAMHQRRQPPAVL